MIAAGEIALWMAMLFAVWGVVAAASGLATHRGALHVSASRALPASAGMLAIALAGVVAALVRDDFSIAYVASVSSHDLPARYAVAAVWSAPPGAALLVALLVACGGALLLAGLRGRVRALATALVGVLLLALLLPLCARDLIFARLSSVPSDGAGLPPELQTPFFLAQAPIAAAAWALTAVHAALALAAALCDSGAHARRARWAALIGWLLAGCAVLVSARWAYHEPAWANRWATRPLADGSLLAWVAIGASGAAWTAHRSWATRLAAPLALIALVCAGVACAVSPLGLAGSTRELLARGVSLSVVAVPVGLAALAWLRVRPGLDAPPPRRAARRGGVALAAIGTVLVLLALVGQQRRLERDVMIADGRPTEVRGPDGVTWTLVGQGVSRFQRENGDVSQLVVELSHDRARAGLLSSERWQAIDLRGRLRGDPVGVVGVRNGVRYDVTLSLIEPSDGGARARVSFEPWAALAWVGGALVLLGGAAALWPR